MANAQNKILDRSGLLSRFSYKDVELPDGAIVRIRALSASYVDDGPEDRFYTVKLLVNSLCDENGNLLFAEQDGDALVATVDSASLLVIMEAVRELTGLQPAGGGDGGMGRAEKN